MEIIKDWNKIKQSNIYIASMWRKSKKARNSAAIKENKRIRYANIFYKYIY